MSPHSCSSRCLSSETTLNRHSKAWQGSGGGFLYAQMYNDRWLVKSFIHYVEHYAVIKNDVHKNINNTGTYFCHRLSKTNEHRIRNGRKHQWAHGDWHICFVFDRFFQYAKCVFISPSPMACMHSHRLAGGFGNCVHDHRAILLNMYL